MYINTLLVNIRTKIHVGYASPLVEMITIPANVIEAIPMCKCSTKYLISVRKSYNIKSQIPWYFLNKSVQYVPRLQNIYTVNIFQVQRERFFSKYFTKFLNLCCRSQSITTLLLLLLY